MAEIVINNPQYLWFFLCLPLLIIVHFYTLRYAKGYALEFANFAALARVAKTPILSKNITLLIARMISLSCIVLAISGTTIWFEGPSTGKDYVLAIDISSSMLAQDYYPTRLSVAKDAAKGFLDELPPRTKVGLVSFAGTSFILMKPTNKLEDVREAIDSIAVQKAGGTDLGEAIVTSTNVLSQSDKEQAIILLTDGRTNVGIQPFEAINYANAHHVNVYTIGVGTPKGGTIEGIKDVVVLSLDELTLKEIAEKTNGAYFKVENPEELKEAYRSIAKVTIQKQSIDLTLILIIVALVISLIDWFLLNTKYRRIP